MGTRVSEIQELTASHTWRYVDTANNPADDLTRGKTLAELATPNRWIQGPAFLRGPPEEWPSCPNITEPEDDSELKHSVFCALTQTSSPPTIPNLTQFSSWRELVKATQQSLHGAAADPTSPLCDLRDAEVHLLKTSQADCFSEEIRCLRVGKPVPPSSRLSTLAPELDTTLGLVRVGGRLRRLDSSSPTDIHPILLDPRHAVTTLLIKEMDAQLHHPGPDRVFAEMRRYYWILRGRQAIKKYQRACAGCMKWRGKPVVPRMVDLPSARLRLLKPPFFSTGVDCFGLYMVKAGRRSEKRWGIIFKCRRQDVYIWICSPASTQMLSSSH